MLTDVLQHLLTAHQAHVDCSPIPHTDKEAITSELKSARDALADLDPPASAAVGRKKEKESA